MTGASASWQERTSNEHQKEHGKPRSDVLLASLVRGVSPGALYPSHESGIFA